MPQIHWMRVLVAAVAAMGIGSVWYSPLMFAKTWAKLSGIDCSKMKAGKKGMVLSYASTFVVCLLMAVAIHILLEELGVRSVLGSMKLAALLWLGFVASVMSGSVIWEKKPVALYLINAGHYLVTIVTMTLILFFQA